MTRETWLAVSYALVLAAVAVYLLIRVRLKFTARGCFLGLFWLLFGPAHLVYLGRLELPLYERITWALMLMWLGTIAGMEITWTIARQSAARATRNREQWQRPLFECETTDRLFAIVAWAVVALLALDVVYENPIGKLRTFVALSGSRDRIAELRGSLGGSAFYFYNVLVASPAPFLAFAAALRAWKRRTIPAAALAGALIALVAVEKAALLTRSALPIFLVQLTLVPVVARSLHIRARVVAATVALVTLLVYPLNYHYLGIGFVDFLKAFADRTLLAPYYGIFNYFSTFPDVLPHAMGRNIRVVNWLFLDDPGYVPAALLFARKAGNYLGAFNGMFIGEAWADFGYWGVGVESALLGVCLSVADMWIFSRPKTASSAAAIVCVMYGIVVLSSTALQTALFSGGLVLIPFLAVLLGSLRLPPVRYGTVMVLE